MYVLWRHIHPTGGEGNDMIITQETVIFFLVPEECSQSDRFGKDHPDWQKETTSVWITYRKKENISAKWEINET